MPARRVLNMNLLTTEKGGHQYRKQRAETSMRQHGLQLTSFCFITTEQVACAPERGLKNKIGVIYKKTF